MAAQFQRLELGFDLDDFRQPILYSGMDAWVRQILQLAIMAPGTIASNPTIGVGMKDYDFLLEDDRRKLAMEINRQVPIFFPDMPFQSCEIATPAASEDQDILYLILSFMTQGGITNAVVAVKKSGYHYIDFSIAM